MKIRRKLLGVALFAGLSLITQPGTASPGSQTTKAKLKARPGSFRPGQALEAAGLRE